MNFCIFPVPYVSKRMWLSVWTRQRLTVTASDWY